MMIALFFTKKSVTLMSSWLDSTPHAGRLESRRRMSYDLAHRLEGGWANLKLTDRTVFPEGILEEDHPKRMEVASRLVCSNANKVHLADNPALSSVPTTRCHTSDVHMLWDNEDTRVANVLYPICVEMK